MLNPVPQPTTLRLWLCMAVLLAGMLAPSASVASWADRAGKLNSRALTSDEAVTRTGEDERDTRNKLSMRRIKPARGSSDWNTDPTAIPFMLYQINKRTDMPVHVDNDGLNVGSDELFERLVVCLTSHDRWSFDEKETENLSKWLKRGGTLLLDDCYNRGSPFADCVGPETGKMIPGARVAMLVASDKRVADTFKMIYASPWPGETVQLGRPWQYFLLDGRAAVFFTPNDDGCGWEISTPPSASNPIGEGIGHGGDNTMREMFYKWITNWMMFVYTH